MITNRGKTFIKQYLAGTAGSFYGAISVGIGDAAATTADTRMQLEFARVSTDVVAYDAVADKLIFKGTLPDSVEGKIYEVGVWTNEVNVNAGNQDSRIITTFDSATEAWDVGSFPSVNNRIGPDNLRLSPTASTTVTSTLTDVSLDLSNSSAADIFTFSYHTVSSNTSNIKYRFMTDLSNYYEIVVTPAATVGYKFSTAAKGSATVVGTPDWQNITILQIATTATAGGTANLDLDSIRLEDVDTVSPDYGLVLRYVPASPITKVAGGPLDVEYALAVNIT